MTNLVRTCGEGAPEGFGVCEASTIDDATRAWMRNASDEAAVRNGCRFNVARAAYSVWWIERYCKLYEGDGFAGEPVMLRGCHQCREYEIQIPDEFDEAVCLERARRYAECVKAGHSIDWQYECTMRVFGWMTFNEMRQRWVRRFREASIWVAKKNKKSPTMAAWGMYLLIGDEEPGQKVFLGSKDGTQIKKNVAAHAKAMVTQSPELDAVCVINKVESTIHHGPSNSWMVPLSSSNIRTTKSKEGLNGSMLVDETHVVDREFMNRVSRAGISRAEPLHAEFSTVGDDPDSYGKERFDLAERVIAGGEERQSLFAAIYAAPQELSDADLDADPVKFARLANPALGHTVDPAELLDDYHNSKRTPANLAQFKMYRLNIWQNSASPWLDYRGWMAGKRDDLRLEDFHGRSCWSALDLASVRDFASLCLAFPESDDAFALFWWYWLPEDTAREVQHLIPIGSWRADPRVNLTLTPGARTDYGYIQSQFRQLAERFSIQELAFDKWNAEKATQEITEGIHDHELRQVQEGTGIPRLEFPQGIQAFNEPTKRFEAAVIDGRILHTGDPLTAWMIQNATIKPDHNGNYKPLKPKKDGVKKIDGVITGIMAFWRSVLSESNAWNFQPGSLAL